MIPRAGAKLARTGRMDDQCSNALCIFLALSAPSDSANPCQSHSSYRIDAICDPTGWPVTGLLTELRYDYASRRQGANWGILLHTIISPQPKLTAWQQPLGSALVEDYYGIVDSILISEAMTVT